MLKISQAFEKITTSLPSYPDSEVIIRTNVSVDDLIMIQNKEIGEIEKAVKIVSKLIISWNFFDDKENPLPITEENIKALPFNDLNHLSEIIEPSLKKKGV